MRLWNAGFNCGESATADHRYPLVERSTGFVQLLHLPTSRSADVVAESMITKIKAFPENLRKTLTWDQGLEMAAHARISIDTGIDIYFCDPHSPWQLTVAAWLQREHQRPASPVLSERHRPVRAFGCLP